MQPVSVCVVHCSQITVTTVEEIDVLKEEVMSSPVLLRVWAEFIDNDYIGAAHLGPRFEGIRWAVERFDYSLGLRRFVKYLDACKRKCPSVSHSTTVRFTALYCAHFICLL